jgi:hypothetical protein
MLLCQVQVHRFERTVCSVYGLLFDGRMPAARSAAAGSVTELALNTAMKYSSWDMLVQVP